jgi:hypothetical protein
MLGMNARRRVQPRRFHYDPRFYDPSKDERVKRKMRVERNRVRPKTKQPHFIAVGLGLVLALYLYLNIGDLTERVAAFGGALFGG